MSSYLEGLRYRFPRFPWHYRRGYAQRMERVQCNMTFPYTINILICYIYRVIYIYMCIYIMCTCIYIYILLLWCRMVLVGFAKPLPSTEIIDRFGANRTYLWGAEDMNSVQRQKKCFWTFGYIYIYTFPSLYLSIVIIGVIITSEKCW